MYYFDQYGELWELEFYTEDWGNGYFDVQAWCEEGEYATVTKYLGYPLDERHTFVEVV